MKNIKNSSLISAAIGGTFFAIPFLGLSVGVIPSLLIGAGAFCAGELVFSKTEKKLPVGLSLKDQIKNARERNVLIELIAPRIEDMELVRNVFEIHDTVAKIIETVERNPEKESQLNNFFEYYLPVTVSILKKYDEIENQKLITPECKEFMANTKNKIININKTFKNQLASLYHSEMVDVDTELKVFEAMLKADGYNSDDEINVSKK